MDRAAVPFSHFPFVGIYLELGIWSLKFAAAAAADSALDSTSFRSIFAPMKSFALLLATGFLLAAAHFAAADPVPPGPGEYVIVTGGVSLHVWEKWKAAPHDGWWMNFVRASRLRINEIQTVNPNADLTWLVYRPAYQARGAQDSR